MLLVFCCSSVFFKISSIKRLLVAI